MYNWTDLFKGVNKEKQQEYFNRITLFIRDVIEAKSINQDIINTYRVKKMRGTKGIFKFYVSNTDGTRCLFNYVDSDDQVFDNEPGIAILRIASHDTQGEVAKRLEKIDAKYMKFLTNDDNDDVGNDSDLEEMMSEQYLKTVYIADSYTNEEIEKIIADEDSKTIYPLSKKQKAALVSDLPTMILGCAGSGKTMLQVAKALKNAHGEVEQAYFTFTKGLKENSETMYHKFGKVPSIKGTTAFFATTDFFLNALNIPLKNYIDYDRFLTFLRKGNYLNRFKYLNSIPTMELWIEIKGIIKGYLGDSYYRNIEIKSLASLKSNELSSQLVESGALEFEHKINVYRIKDAYKLFNLSQKSPSLNDFLFNNDFNESLLDDYSYIEVNDNYSRFSKEDRKNILDFVKRHYQTYLDSNGLYDDNDLARLYIIKARKGEVKKFDFAYLDEVQDLSEMQIYALMQATHTPGKLYMTGDISQIINPTFFKGGRPGVLIRNRLNQSWNKDNVVKLDENYRNSAEIVNVANKLVSIRKERLGSYSEYIFEEPKKIEKITGLPAILHVNKTVILEAIGGWIDTPKVAIVVANEESKNRLIKELDLDTRRQGSNIFTVQEVKGQEFEKVILYNVLYEYKDAWKELMTSDVKSNQEYYQFYFNLFYVALTRAKKNIYIFEHDSQLEIIKELREYLEPITKEVLTLLDTSDYQNKEDVLEQAESYFKNEEYDRARILYLRIDDKKKAHLCKGYLFLKRGEYEKGLENLYVLKHELPKIFEYTDKNKTLLFHILIGFRTGKLTIRQISDIVGTRKIIDLIKPYKNKPKDLYQKMLLDTIDVMQKVNNYQINKQLEEFYG